ncbi:unannotated protein [freshwater metagenome]|uniref:Unannotated protein n=1 Tax=freshwater metagenome TaxID=449393 RepID=A0A6J7ADZ4_9ZZZZ
MIPIGQQIWAGILFEPELLNEPWFLLLGAFVSFNTIVFVGLSLGKVFYWPRVRIRPHPHQVKDERAQEK